MTDNTRPQQPSSPHTEERSAHGAASAVRGKAEEARAFWYDKQHRDLLFYLAIAIFFLECIVGGVAFFYGVIHAEMGVDGVPRFQFPWLAYLIAAVVAPAGLLLIVHLAGVGLFRSMRGREDDEAWRKDLPDRLRKVYAIIQGAPTVVLLLGIMLLGAALFYFDGAMSALFRLGATAERYLPWIIGGVVGAWCVGYVARLWLNYRTRRMEAEFAFRREVLERTGVIIVDRGSMRLPPADATPAAALALEGERGNGALPPGQVPPGEGPVLDVTPATPEEPGPENGEPDAAPKK